MKLMCYISVSERANISENRFHRRRDTKVNFFLCTYEWKIYFFLYHHSWKRYLSGLASLHICVLKMTLFNFNYRSVDEGVKNRTVKSRSASASSNPQLRWFSPEDRWRFKCWRAVSRCVSRARPLHRYPAKNSAISTAMRKIELESRGLAQSTAQMARNDGNFRGYWFPRVQVRAGVRTTLGQGGQQPSTKTTKLRREKFGRREIEDLQFDLTIWFGYSREEQMFPQIQWRA